MTTTVLNPQPSNTKANGFGFGEWLDGIRILESSHCQERVWWRKPRTKKRRIRRKWELREENNRYEPRAYKLDANTVMVHPSIAKKLREGMPSNGSSSPTGADRK